MLVGTPEVYGNFSGSDVNGFSVAARELAKRVAGVTINPHPANLDHRGLLRKILIGSFDLLVNPEAKPLVHCVMNSPEVKLFYDVGAFPYPGPHNIGSFCEAEEEPNFSLITDAAKRIKIAKLQREALLDQTKADFVFKKDPLEGIRYDIKAISAERRAQWLSENLLPIEDIINQVIERERALLTSPAD